MRSLRAGWLVGALLLYAVPGCREDPVQPPASEPPETPQYTIWPADTYAHAGGVRIYWDATPILEVFQLPPEPQRVEVELSTASANTGFRVVASSATIGPDSATVEGLDDGALHWLRVVSYDATGRLVGRSRVVETIPGPPAEPAVVIPAFQRGFLSRSLAWSPEGDQLAFVKADGCVRANVHCYDLETGELRPVTDFAADEQILSHVGWSPDGSRLAFGYSPTRTYYAIDYRVWLVPRAGEGPRSVTSGRFDAHPAWIDDRTLVFVRFTDSPQAPEIQRLTLGAEPQVTPVSNDGRIWKADLAVSPDGSTIAYSGQAPGSSPTSSLYTIECGGGDSRLLLPPDAWDDVHPAWHPNARRLYFASDRCGHFEVWSLDLATRELRQITRARRPFGEHYDPAPSPDGRRLAVLAWMGSPSTIEILALGAP